jgi:hypothetical protein
MRPVKVPMWPFLLAMLAVGPVVGGLILHPVPTILALALVAGLGIAVKAGRVRLPARRAHRVALALVAVALLLAAWAMLPTDDANPCDRWVARAAKIFADAGKYYGSGQRAAVREACHAYGYGEAP